LFYIINKLVSCKNDSPIDHSDLSLYSNKINVLRHNVYVLLLMSE